MGHIASQLNEIKLTLPPQVILVAVSKFHPVEAIMEAYDAGQRVFGESRAVELVKKAQELPGDIQWHFIGHLQTNKVRSILPYVTLIQSIDSERLLRLVDSEAARIGKMADVLLQLHVALEETKFGFSPEEIHEFASSGILSGLQHVRVRGVMGMASNVDDESRVIADFKAIRKVFDELKSGVMHGNEAFDTVSMGMSHDYLGAIECGGTMVRIGTTIFGNREY